MPLIPRPQAKKSSFTKIDMDQHMRGPESGFAVPHVVNLQAAIGSAWQTYYHSMFDEAIRNNPANAEAMRNDPFIRRLINERKHAVCSLKVSIEVDNDRDPWQKAVKDSLTQQWNSLPSRYDLNWYMLEAIWYGRYGAQFNWDWKISDLPALPRAGGASPGLPAILGASTGREKRRVLYMRNHMPTEGDKIGYDYYGCPYVLISTTAEIELANRGENYDVGPIPPINAKSMETGYTTVGGKALFLRSSSWRERYAIHAGEILDGPFTNGYAGDIIHGIGIRSVIYWYWWLRDEFMSNVADWCARTGLGIRLWYYDASNPQSKNEVSQVAKDQSDKVNIMVPRFPGSEAQEGVEFVDTSSSGADLLLRLIQYLDENIELYVVGQSMSRGSQENNGSGFGDRGRADFAMGTKNQITRMDAAKYGDTMTNDVLNVLKKWSLPKDLHEIPARVVYSVDVPNVIDYMKGVETYVGLGGTVRDAEVRNVLGLGDPHEGEPTLGGKEYMESQQNKGMPGQEENPVDHDELPQGEKKAKGAGAGNGFHGRQSLNGV
jgi:hypothetical protein